MAVANCFCPFKRYWDNNSDDDKDRRGGLWFLVPRIPLSGRLAPLEAALGSDKT